MTELPRQMYRGDKAVVGQGISLDAYAGRQFTAWKFYGQDNTKRSDTGMIPVPEAEVAITAVFPRLTEESAEEVFPM